ncbi:MAG: DUF116 domain-containing protein [Peptostreptococcaceae bacterium]
MVKIVLLLVLLIIANLIVFNLFISSMLNLFGIIFNSISILILFLILFSLITTKSILDDKKVNISIMKMNFKIITIFFGIINILSSFIKIPKDEIRKIYIKLNNTYIYSNKYNLDDKDILVLIPHCIQKSICKLKITTDIKVCKGCGMCDVSDLVKLNDKVEVFIATGGTLARKKIIEKNPKAVIAVACERDLTSGIIDIKHIPVLGVLNKRPNGPCVDTSIEIDEINFAIDFLRGN